MSGPEATDDAEKEKEGSSSCSQDGSMVSGDEESYESAVSWVLGRATFLFFWEDVLKSELQSRQLNATKWEKLFDEGPLAKDDDQLPKTEFWD